ncbi:MAG: twin-arginine translocase TatA/TatE family subunit [Synechococcales cyanobacterium RM1_1_8]|nr:twin-arginine translocase TatA/TatE family subunit [Synechococcales cyanobacterium RM1_1_8]
MNIGWVEVALVVGLAVLVFGPKKIPQFGAAFGKTLRGFKEELKGETEVNERDEAKIIDR